MGGGGGGGGEVGRWERGNQTRARESRNRSSYHEFMSPKELVSRKDEKDSEFYLFIRLVRTNVPIVEKRSDENLEVRKIALKRPTDEQFIMSCVSN